MPYPPLVLHLEFPELFEGAFLDLRHPLRLSWGEQRRVVDGIEDAAERSNAVVAHLIQGTNLAPADAEDEGPFSIPFQAQDIDRLPSLVMVRILEVVNPPLPVAAGNGSPIRTKRSKSGS